MEWEMSGLIVKTFAFSRLYYLASILPLPQWTAKQIDSAVGKIIWAASGKIFRLHSDEMKLPAKAGGGGLKCVRRMSKSLLLTQVLRLWKSSDEKYIGYFG